MTILSFPDFGDGNRRIQTCLGTGQRSKSTSPYKTVRGLSRQKSLKNNKQKRTFQETDHVPIKGDNDISWRTEKGSDLSKTDSHKKDLNIT